MVDLNEKSEEVELSMALKQKQRNCERLDKRKAKSLADKSSKPAEEPGATLEQTAARNSRSSTVVSSTPVSLDADVEMAPVVALPEGELKEGQIYHFVNGRLVVYHQVHLNTDQASSGSPPEVTSAPPSLNSQNHTWRSLDKICQPSQPPLVWRKSWLS